MFRCKICHKLVARCGVAVAATRIAYFDLAVGAAIGVCVVKDALAILSEARAARALSGIDGLLTDASQMARARALSLAGSACAIHRHRTNRRLANRRNPPQSD